MTDYRDTLSETISSGRLWRAKEILQGRLANTKYDPELFHLYGDVLKQMGDLRLAGRFFFLSGHDDVKNNDCVSIFKDRDCRGTFSDFWGTMPKSVQNSAKDEIPNAVLDELVGLGFKKSEFDTVFDRTEKRLLERKKRKAENGSDQWDWTDILVLTVFLLLIVGLLYQAVIGVFALWNLVVSWISI
ncbi:MAG: hypothetical protein ACRBCJ_13515 [Hyphomicrobiaceae bacterium]